MTITSAKTGVWILDDAYKKIASGCWVQYNLEADPGTLWAWGANDEGRLGDGTQTRRSSPVQIPGTQWVNVKPGPNHSIARKSDGTLWVWGRGGIGESLGNQTYTVTNVSPLQIPGTQWNDIAAADGMSMARKCDGTLWSWGCGQFGKLGQNSTYHRNSPAQVPGTQWTAIDSGSNNTVFARKSDGTLWAWGNNSRGQLGRDNILTTNCVSSPVQIPGTAWSDVAAGNQHVLARKSDGTLWTWGYNGTGQLARGPTGAYSAVSSPVQIPGTAWNDIAASAQSSFARKTDGTLWAWGHNDRGTLGIDVRTHRSSPVQVPGTQWREITGGSFTGFARKNDNTLWAWGSGDDGRLGTGSVVYASSPTQIPGTVWTEIAAQGGARHSFARKA